MKIGIALPNNWGLEDVHEVVGLGTLAEELGFDSVWTQDHLFNCGYVHERIGARPYYHPLALLSHLSGRTERVALGTSVMVLPYHDPVELAKYAATLDQLSSGRLILGIGVGAMAEEFEALGVPMRRRGALTDESIEVMRELWTAEKATHHGQRWKFENMTFSPKCLQQPHVPLWVGGASPPALDRTARIATGWQPVGLSPSAYDDARQDLARRTRAAGRNPDEITLSIRIDVDADAPARERNAALGRTTVPGDDMAAVLACLREFDAVGVSHALLAPASSDATWLRDLYTDIAEHVINRF